MNFWYNKNKKNNEYHLIKIIVIMIKIIFIINKKNLNVQKLTLGRLLRRVLIFTLAWLSWVWVNLFNLGSNPQALSSSSSSSSTWSKRGFRGKASISGGDTFGTSRGGYRYCPGGSVKLTPRQELNIVNTHYGYHSFYLSGGGAQSPQPFSLSRSLETSIYQFFEI